MLLITGLGNPGKEYGDTPHNAGFFFLDMFREYVGWDSYYEVDNWKFDKYYKSEISHAKIEGEVKVIFQKPQTFMNNSGGAVFVAVQKNSIRTAEEFVLVHDDLDLRLGEFKIVKNKAPKSHNGVESVERSLGNNFLRVRLGVDNREPGPYREPGEDYVLRPYSPEEIEILRNTVKEASKHLRGVLTL